MAAVATQRMDVSQSIPVITPEVRAQLAMERKRLLADPGRAQLAAELTFSAKHIYRSKPGTHMHILHQLPMPPEEAASGDEKQFNFALRRWKAIVAQPWFPDLPREKAAEKLIAYLDGVRDALGDTQLKFTRVPRHKECYFVTNNDVIAGYIDRLIERKIGEFAHVYKEQKARVVVGLGTDLAQAFPNTDGGWRLARAYAAEHDITSIELVKE